MTTSTTLPIDTYYRGYRFSILHDIIHIYHFADYIDCALTVTAAQRIVDEWMIAP